MDRGLSAIKERFRQRRDSGDTLFEVLVAISIIAITSVGVLTGFETAISATTEETHLSQIATVLKSYAEVATADLQENLDAAGTATYYESCGTASYYKTLLASGDTNITALPTTPSGYSVSLTSVTYWNGSAFVSSCTSGSTNPQLLTITATGPSAVTQTLSFAISDLNYVAQAEVTPEFTDSSPYTYTVAQGSTFTYTVTTSQGSPSPAITASGLPTGVTFTDNGNGTGTLSGTASVAAGSYTLTFTANNSVGSAATLTFDLVVASAPVFSGATTASFPECTVSQNSCPSQSFTVSASDTDSESPHMALETTVSGALKNMIFTDNGNGTGTLSGKLVTNTSGTYTLTFESANSLDVSSTETVTIYVPTAPVFTSSFTSQHWAEGSSVDFSVSATDTNDSALPSLSVLSGLTGALSGLTFTDNGNGTGALTGTVANANPGAYTITFEATNSAGVSVTQTLSVEVVSAPVFTSGTSQSWEECTGTCSTMTFTVTAMDTDTSSPTLSLDSTLSGALASFKFTPGGNGSGTFSGALVKNDAGVYTVTFAAENSVNVTTTQKVVFTIASAPVFAGTTPTALPECTASSQSGCTTQSYTVTWTDTDSVSPTLTETTSLTGALADMTFKDNGDGTGTLSGPLIRNDTGIYTVTFKAENSAGTTTSQNVVIYVPTTPTFSGSTSFTFTEGESLSPTSSGKIATSADTDDYNQPTFPSSMFPTLTSPLNGLTFVDNGDGTLGLSGTVGHSLLSSKSFTIYAENSAGVMASETIHITVIA